MRVTRILPQLLDQLRPLLAQLCDAPLELCDSRVLGSELLITLG